MTTRRSDPSGFMDKAGGLFLCYALRDEQLLNEEHVMTPPPLPDIDALLERGRVCHAAGDPHTACGWFQQAYDAATAQQDDAFAIDALHMLGIADVPSARLGWNQQALRLAEQSQQPRAISWQGALLDTCGWFTFEQGDYPLALEYFEQAQTVREQQGEVRATLVARWCVARALRALGRVEEALGKQGEIRAAWLGAGLTPDGYGTEEIAECLLALGRRDEARPYFASAYVLFTARGTLVDQPERLARIRQLGEGIQDQGPNQ